MRVSSERCPDLPRDDPVLRRHEADGCPLRGVRPCKIRRSDTSVESQFISPRRSGDSEAVSIVPTNAQREPRSRRRAGIQNAGVVLHERHEQHTGHRALPGSVHSQRAELKKGDCRSGRSYPEKLFPLSFSSLRGELSAFEMDAQYAARAAHAYDPSVLDAGTT